MASEEFHRSAYFRAVIQIISFYHGCCSWAVDVYCELKLLIEWYIRNTSKYVANVYYNPISND